MPSGKVFISYRRDDSSGYAHLLYDRLNKRFPGKIFMDVSAINPGTDFVQAIERAVGSCDALIAIIGKRWLSTTGTDSRRRLDDPADLVRLEIASALSREIRVIPVLFQGAAMPAAEELPENISSLTRRQAIELSDANLDRDAERLISALETEPGEQKEATGEAVGNPIKRYWPIGAVVALAVFLFFFFSKKSDQSPTPSVSTPKTDEQAASGGPSDMKQSIDQLAEAAKTALLTGQGQVAPRSTLKPPSFEFDPVGKWVVTVQKPIAGTMVLNLKSDRTYEITKPSGALGPFSQLMGSSGNWLYSPKTGSLDFIQENGRMKFPIQITEKKNNGIYGEDGQNVIYIFTRE